MEKKNKPLVVTQRIRKLIKGEGMRISLPAIAKLNKVTEEELRKAITIAKEEGRTTILARDLPLKNEVDKNGMD